MISVIIPVYNSEKYIENLLEDLWNQTYKDLQILIINDGSKDNSQDIIDRYVKKDSRATGIKTVNQGVSMARNTGLKHATGEYIRFLDADDRIPENSMLELLNAMESDEEIDMVIGSFREIPENFLYYGEKGKIGKITIQELMKDFVQFTRSFYYGVNWNKLYKRDIIVNNNIQFEPGVIWSEDFFFNLEYYKQCRYCYRLKLNVPIYDYVHNEESITSTIKRDNSKALVEIDEKRKIAARRLFEYYGMEKEYDLVWKYAFLHYDMNYITKNKEHKKIREVYGEFKTLFEDESVLDYIKLKMKLEKRDWFWRYMYYSVNKKKYRLLFVLFRFRGFFANRLGRIKPLRNRFYIGRKGKTL